MEMYVCVPLFAAWGALKALWNGGVGHKNEGQRKEGIFMLSE